MISIATIIILSLFIVVIFGIMFLLNNMNKMKKFTYRIVFLREQNDVLVFHKSIKLQSIERNIISYDNKSYKLDVTKSNYINKNREFVYFLDYDNGNTKNIRDFKEKEILNVENNNIEFNNEDAIAEPETLEMLVSNNIVSQITKGVTRDKFDWKNFLFGALFGAFTVLLIVFIMKEMEEPETSYYTNLPDLSYLLNNLRCLRLTML